MKKNQNKNSAPFAILSALVLAAALSAVPSSFAETSTARPCKEIKTACEAGGFTKGAHKKTERGLFVDCIKKVMNGETVEGVSVTADQVTSCKARKEKHAAKRAARKAAKGTT